MLHSFKRASGLADSISFPAGVQSTLALNLLKNVSVLGASQMVYRYDWSDQFFLGLCSRATQRKMYIYTSFDGHFFAGGAFLLFGLASMWSTLQRYHRSRLNPTSPPYRSRLRIIPGRLCIDSLFLGGAAIGGLIGKGHKCILVALTLQIQRGKGFPKFVIMLYEIDKSALHRLQDKPKSCFAYIKKGEEVERCLVSIILVSNKSIGLQAYM